MDSEPIGETDSNLDDMDLGRMLCHHQIDMKYIFTKELKLLGRALTCGNTAIEMLIDASPTSTLAQKVTLIMFTRELRRMMAIKSLVEIASGDNVESLSRATYESFLHHRFVCGRFIDKAEYTNEVRGHIDSLPSDPCDCSPDLRALLYLYYDERKRMNFIREWSDDSATLCQIQEYKTEATKEVAKYGVATEAEWNEWVKATKRTWKMNVLAAYCGVSQWHQHYQRLNWSVHSGNHGRYLGPDQVIDLFHSQWIEITRDATVFAINVFLLLASEGLEQFNCSVPSDVGAILNECRDILI